MGGVLHYTVEPAHWIHAVDRLRAGQRNEHGLRATFADLMGIAAGEPARDHL
jgi:hypothetical protein